MQVWFNYTARNAAITIQEDNIQKHLIFDYNTDQIHIVTCSLSFYF